LCAEVQKRRAANPRFKLSLDLNVIANEVDLQNSERLKHIKNAGHFIIEDTGGASVQSPFTGITRKIRNVLGAGADKFSNYKAGLSVGYSWFGTGLQPIVQASADGRAKICSTCPQNQPEDWLARFAAPVIAVVKQQLEAKADMELRTPYDDTLKQCKACDCVLTLKVWTPIDHILETMTEEKFARLDERCWVLAERK
jgi:hypothetical protein